MSSDNATAPPTDRRPAAADPAGTGHEPGANRQAGRVRRPGGIRPAGTVPPARTPRRRPRASRRRAVSIILAGCLSLGAAAGLAQGITACQPAVQPDTSRPLAAAEADRLARMRLQNYQDGRAGFRATIGQPGRQVRLTGWVDWQRTLAYFAVRSAGEIRTLNCRHQMITLW